MAGIVSFTVDLKQENPHVIAEREGRLKDLRPAFEVIIQKWVEGNRDKFEKGLGQEASGVDQGSGVDWEQLTPNYMKSKRRLGQGNQLMVATGALEAAMTNPDALFQLVNPEQAMFGTPLDSEEADKIRYNWNKRQALFLSIEDQRMIQKTIYDYFDLGENFEQILFAKGLDAVRRRQQMAQMDVEFNAVVNG